MSKGVVCVTLDDETGVINVIVWKAIGDVQCAPRLESKLLAVYAEWQSQRELRHLIVEDLADADPGRPGISSDRHHAPNGFSNEFFNPVP